MSPVELGTRPSPTEAHGDQARPRRRPGGDATVRRLLMALTAGQTADAMTTLALTQVVAVGLAGDSAVSPFLAVGAGMTVIGVTRHLLTIGGTRNLVPTGRIP